MNETHQTPIECSGRVFERNPQPGTADQAGAVRRPNSRQPPDPAPEQIASQRAFYEKHNTPRHALEAVGDEKKPLFDWETFDRSMGDASECDGLLTRFLAEKAAYRAALESDSLHRE
jgi:hypothetical protein